MSKKLLKLVLGSLILAGGLMGQAPKEAEASWCPPYYCCDLQCSGIYRCWQVGGSCICEEFCTYEPDW